MSNQIVNTERIKTLNETLQRSAGNMGKVAAKHLSPERLIKVAVGAAMRNPTLLMCDPRTVVRAVLQGAELGLEPGSALGEAYLVPFKNNKVSPPIWECQLIPGYRGLVALARRSGEIATITSGVIYVGDTFEFKKGSDPFIDHIPNLDNVLPDRFWPANEDERENEVAVECRYDKIRCFYAVAVFKDGSKQIEIMTRSEVDRIRQRSMARNSGPWVSDYEEMGKKTVVKRLSKMLPMSVEFARAVALDNAIDTGDFTDVEFDLPESQVADENAQQHAAPTTGVEGVKADLGIGGDKKAEGKSAEDLAALVKHYKLTQDHTVEIEHKLKGLQNPPSLDQFLADSKAEGTRGFMDLLKRVDTLLQAEAASGSEEEEQGQLV